MQRVVTRRRLLTYGFGVAGVSLLASCSGGGSAAAPTAATAPTVAANPAPTSPPATAAATQNQSPSPTTAAASQEQSTPLTTTSTTAGGKSTGYEWKSVGDRQAGSGTTTIDLGSRQVLVSKAGKANLEFWTINLKGPYGTWIQSFLKDYQTVNPGVNVTWVDVPGAQTAQKYLAAVGAGQAPDLANTYEMPRFIELGALADIASYLPKEDASDFYPGFWNALTFDGKVYGFPWYTGTNTLVYSRKIMQDAGLSPDSPPKTWDNAITMSKTIKDKAGKYGLLMTVGQGELVELLQQAGIPMVSDDRKKAALNTPDAVKLFQQWQDFYKGGYLPPEGTTADPRDANQWFYAGRGAFVSGGPVVIVKRADPSVLTQWDTDLSGSIRGTNGKSIASLQYLIVSNKSKNVQAAVDLGAYLTGTGLQIEFINQVPILPTRQSVSDDPTFRKKFIDKPVTGRSQQELLDRGFQLSLAELKDAIVDYNAAPSVVPWARMYDTFKQETNKLFAVNQPADQTLGNIEKNWNDILSGKTTGG
ncbi:MAG: ABC transporter substrate-binding protein [Chloroflexota bacterium]